MPSLVRGVGGRLLRGPGGLLARGGDCCCDGQGVVDDCPPCCCVEYEYTLTGVTGGVQCAADLDGTYTLGEQIPCHTWQKTPIGGVAAFLTHNEEPTATCGQYRLTIGPTIVDSASATYALSGDDWDCNGCNVMILESEDGPCAWPETVEVCCTGQDP